MVLLVALPQTFEALADPTRLKIIDAVRDQERSVGELVQLVGMHQPGISRHLKVLRTAGQTPPLPRPLRPPERARRLARAAPEGPQRPARPPRGPPRPRRPTRGPPVTTDSRSASAHGTVDREGQEGTIRFERVLAHPVDRVWTAITTPKGLADWWLPFPADIDIDLQVGGLIAFSAPEFGPASMTC